MSWGAPARRFYGGMCLTSQALECFPVKSGGLTAENGHILPIMAGSRDHDIMSQILSRFPLSLWESLGQLRGAKPEKR